MGDLEKTNKNDKEQKVEGLEKINKNDFTLMNEAGEIFYDYWHFENINLEEIDNVYFKVEFDGCVFSTCDFSNIIFEECIFEECLFSNCNFVNVEFKECKLSRCNFSDPSIFSLDIDVRTSILEEVKFGQTNINT